MSLQPIDQMIRAARDGRYAVGYFESWNLESLQGVVDAAEETRSPVIIGFNGDFLARTARCAKDRLAIYAAMGRAAADAASVPCGLIFNECPNDEWVRRAARSGFNLVMLADPNAPHEQYTRRVARLVRDLRGSGVAVESEIGELPCGASGSVGSGGATTDPVCAARFVRETGTDLLAVSVGNVHIMVSGEQSLDLERLELIRREVDAPLVLHGGSGIKADSLRHAIERGVVKVNYGTYLKQRYLTAVRKSLGGEAANPHELLGIGGNDDVMVAGRLAVRNAVLERIELLGCCGRA